MRKQRETDGLMKKKCQDNVTSHSLVWEAHGPPSTCQCPRKWIELMRSDKSTTSASLDQCVRK